MKLVPTIYIRRPSTSGTISGVQNVEYPLFEYQLVATNNAGIQGMSNAQTAAIFWEVVC